MNDADRERAEAVLEIYRDLALSTKFGNVDAIQFMAFWQDLADLPLEAIRTAALRWKRREGVFPSSAEWRAEALRAMEPPKTPTSIHCERCGDSGFEPTATGVRRCPCRATNPALAAQRQEVARRQV
jgi:hypothetical protein